MRYSRLEGKDQGLKRFLESPDTDGSFYVGHATVLARIDGYLYLIDGVYPRPLFLDSWLFFPPLAMDAQLLDVDGIFISHCHEDHYDLNFLRDLKPHTPIYITQGRLGFEDLLNDKNLNVIELPHFEKFKLNEKVSALAIPSDHNGIDSSFFLKGTKFSLFQGNDNFVNEESLVRAKHIVGKVSHAYIPYSYVWWYPYCLSSLSEEKRKFEATRLTRLNMKIGARMAEIFESDLVVQSAGNLVFFDTADSIINREIASPFDFIDYVSECHPTISDKTLPLFSGDFVFRKEDGDIVYSRQIDKKTYFDEMDYFLNEMHASGTQVIPSPRLEHETCKILNERLSHKTLPKLDLDLYFYPSDKRERALMISMRDYIFEVADTPETYPGSMQFSIEPRVFQKWVNGQISLETVLNSQRFLVHRNPEVFNKEAWDILRTCF